jgi:transcriptional regulator with GAF, ATPase, and Fis domain
VTLSESETFYVDEAWLTRRPAAVPQSNAALDGVLLAHEKDAIENALEQCQGRVSGPGGAAAKLGMRASTLESRIRRFGIDKYWFKSK